MAKSFETKVEINGAIGSSFTQAFRNANSGLVDLRTEARAVQKELDRLGRDFRQGKIHQSQYTDETRKLTNELKSLENAQKRQLSTQNSLSAVKSSAGNLYHSTKAVAGVAAIGAGAAVTAGLVNTVSTAAEFEQQMGKVGAKIEASNSEMQALNETALSLGASSSLSASEVAQAMDELGAKGMDANKIIAAMPGLISAAEASGEDLKTVSDVVTSALNSYGMSAEDSSHIADVLAMSANKTAAGVEDLGYSFKYAAPVAKQLGIKFEELTAVTGILVDKGLQGEQAGTALRMALTRLASPPTAAKKALDKLNISATDSSGKFKSLTQISKDWEEATKDLSDAQKVQYASTIFGTEASTAMLSLFSSGSGSIKEITDALENSGGVAEKAAIKMKDNYGGALEQMSGAFESAKIAFATPILPVLQDVFNGIAGTIESNMGSIENAGRAVAEVLKDITAPFSAAEPIKPKIIPHMDPQEVEQVMKQYNEELEKYELFNGMSFSEKIGYMLDETGDVIQNWLKGDGKEVINTVFTELGTIAGTAWLTAFSTTATGAISSAFEGDFAGALGMGAMANMMTGGLLLTGGLAGGKWAFGKAKDAFSKNKNTTSNNKATVSTVESTKKAEEASKASAKTAESVTKTSSALSKLTKVGKVAGKAFIPLGIATSTIDIATSDDKSKAVGSAAGGIGGALGGAALGATLGSVIPVLGTTAGGIIGGIAGSLGGSALGGWIGEKIGDNNSSASSTTSNETADFSNLSASTNRATANMDILTTYLGQASGYVFGSFYPLSEKARLMTNNVSVLTTYLGQASGYVFGSFYPLGEKVGLMTNNVSVLTTYLGQASGYVFGSFYPLKEATDLATFNMNTLVSYIGQASGWINTLRNIQSAGERVVEALNSFERRINATDIGTSGRLSYE